MAASKFNPQTRFNWGFHDGAADVASSRENKWAATPHFSNEYRQGYLAGFSAAKRGESTESSEPAWFNALAWGDV